MHSNLGCAIGGHVSFDSSAGVLEWNSTAVSRCAHATWLSVAVSHVSFQAVLNFNFEDVVHHLLQVLPLSFLAQRCSTEDFP